MKNCSIEMLDFFVDLCWFFYNIPLFIKKEILTKNLFKDNVKIVVVVTAGPSYTQVCYITTFLL